MPAFRWNRLFATAIILLIGTAAAALYAAPAIDAPALPSDSDPIFLCIELSDPPTIETYKTVRDAHPGPQDAAIAAANRAAAERLGAVTKIQNAFLKELAKVPGVKLQFTMRKLFNGVIVKTFRGNRDKLLQLPGVRALHRIVPQKPLNAHGVPLIGAAAIWQNMGLPLTGEGITIGVIDSGIDYLHADFGGPGDAADYDGNDTTVLGDAEFPTAKVIDGWDFVGEDYDPEEEAYDTPIPDPDPFDSRIGHGTHVAGTIAGVGVNADGTSYSESYDQSLPFSSVRIGPGVAPKASLIALKVFGTGSTIQATEAAEWAADPNDDGDFSDHLDVVNLSLGGSFSGADEYGNEVYTNAVEAGVIVVAAAGNDGDITMATGSPATVPAAIAVAASVHDGMSYLALTVDSPAAIAGDYVAVEAGFGPELTEDPLGGELVRTNPRDACRDITNPNDIAGKIALIDRGDCYFVDKVRRAQEAGAIAVVVINNVEGWAIVMGGSGVGLTIPSLMISQEDGQTIAAELANGVNVRMAATNVVYQPELADTLGDFSSRGPTHASHMPLLKPDLTAPGVSVMSAATLTGSRGFEGSGTSMATPHMAGAMALIRQFHPDWTVHELKALAMNTSTVDLKDDAGSDTYYAPSRIGSGRVELRYATASNLIAYDLNHPERVSVTFSVLDVISTNQQAATVRIENKGDVEITVTPSIDTRVDMQGVAVAISDDSPITIDAGGFADIEVTFSADPGNMKRAHDATISEVSLYSGSARSWLSEETGYIILTPEGDDPALRVPFYAAPRPASDMATVSGQIPLGEERKGETSVELTGTGVNTGDDVPFDTQSLVSAFELKIVSPDEVIPGLSEKEDDLFADSNDFAFIGIASDYAERVAAGGDPDDAIISFAIATHGPWGNPGMAQFYIAIDNNLDDNPDFIVFSSFYDYDVYGAIVYNMRSRNYVDVRPLNGYSPDAYDLPLFFSDALVLPVAARSIGLGGENTKFNVHFESMMDYTNSLEYDMAAPCLTFDSDRRGIATQPDVDGASIPVSYDLDACEQSGTRGMLLIHHHNENGKRAEVVYLEGLYCEEDTDCNEETPYCQLANHTCVECKEDAHCPEGLTCLIRTGECITDEPTDGDVTDGDVTDGDVTDGDATDGDATDGDVTDGDTTDGDVTDGDASDGDATDGDLPDGECTPGERSCENNNVIACRADGEGTYIRQRCGDGSCVDGACLPNYERPEPDGDETDGDEPDLPWNGSGSGCSATGSAGIWGLLLAGAFLARRRRCN